MHLALLLIALGFGYKLYVEASQQKSKNLKRLGKAIGVVVMLVSFLAALCFVSCGLQMCSKGQCPLMPGKMEKMGMVGKMCPITGKTLEEHVEMEKKD